jgi:MFS family permease
MFNSATALSPALGGLTYALFGPGWCFTINGLSFVAIIAALAVMKMAPFEAKAEQNSILTDLKEGIRYVTAEPMIRTIISLVGVFSLFGLAFATLVPAWAVNILGGNAATNGLLLSSRGLGALVGALMIASLGRFTFRGKLLSFGSLAFPALLFVFSLMRVLPLSLIVLFCLGFSQILVLNLANSTVQTLTPGSLRGRVMGIYTFTFFGLMPIGALFIGGMAGRYSEPAAIWINVVIIALFSGLIWIFMPKLRRLQ